MFFGKEKSIEHDPLVKEGVPPVDNRDAIDRIFGFAERMVCSADNTTDVEIDPIRLRKLEATRTVPCGGNTSNVVFENDEDDDVSDACQELLAKLAFRKANKAAAAEKSLISSNSDETGNTDVSEIIEGGGSTVNNKRRWRGFFRVFACKGRQVEESVAVVPETAPRATSVSATPRATHYEITA